MHKHNRYNHSIRDAHQVEEKLGGVAKGVVSEGSGSVFRGRQGLQEPRRCCICHADYQVSILDSRDLLCTRCLHSHRAFKSIFANIQIRVVAYPNR
jgi:hypothetical protein